MDKIQKKEIVSVSYYLHVYVNVAEFNGHT
jgi:hypothetical protein